MDFLWDWSGKMFLKLQGFGARMSTRLNITEKGWKKHHSKPVAKPPKGQWLKLLKTPALFLKVEIMKPYNKSIQYDLTNYKTVFFML